MTDDDGALNEMINCLKTHRPVCIVAIRPSHAANPYTSAEVMLDQDKPPTRLLYSLALALHFSATAFDKYSDHLGLSKMAREEMLRDALEHIHRIEKAPGAKMETGFRNIEEETNGG